MVLVLDGYSSMKDDYQEYLDFKSYQITKTFEHTYMFTKGQVPLLAWAGLQGIDKTRWMPTSHTDWLENRDKHACWRKYTELKNFMGTTNGKKD